MRRHVAMHECRTELLRGWRRWMACAHDGSMVLSKLRAGGARWCRPRRWRAFLLWRARTLALEHAHLRVQCHAGHGVPTGLRCSWRVWQLWVSERDRLRRQVKHGEAMLRQRQARVLVSWRGVAAAKQEAVRAMCHMVWREQLRGWRKLVAVGVQAARLSVGLRHLLWRQHSRGWRSWQLHTQQHAKSLSLGQQYNAHWQQYGTGKAWRAWCAQVETRRMRRHVAMHECRTELLRGWRRWMACAHDGSMVLSKLRAGGARWCRPRRWRAFLLWRARTLALEHAHLRVQCHAVHGVPTGLRCSWRVWQSWVCERDRLRQQVKRGEQILRQRQARVLVLWRGVAAAEHEIVRVMRHMVFREQLRGWRRLMAVHVREARLRTGLLHILRQQLSRGWRSWLLHTLPRASGRIVAAKSIERVKTCMAAQANNLSSRHRMPSYRGADFQSGRLDWSADEVVYTFGMDGACNPLWSFCVRRLHLLDKFIQLP